MFFKTLAGLMLALKSNLECQILHAMKPNET